MSVSYNQAVISFKCLETRPRKDYMQHLICSFLETEGLQCFAQFSFPAKLAGMLQPNYLVCCNQISWYVAAKLAGRLQPNRLVFCSQIRWYVAAKLACMLQPNYLVCCSQIIWCVAAKLSGVLQPNYLVCCSQIS